MTIASRITIGAATAATYLLCSWPLYVLSAISALSLFSGSIGLTAGLMTAFWALIGAPAMLAAYVARRIDPRARVPSLTGLWLCVSLMLFVGAIALGPESQSDGVIGALLHPAMAIAVVFAGAFKGSRAGAFLVLCLLAGFGAFASTWLPRRPGRE